MSILFFAVRSVFTAALLGMAAEWVVMEITGRWSQHPWHYLPILALFAAFRELTIFIEKEVEA